MSGTESKDRPTKETAAAMPTVPVQATSQSVEAVKPPITALDAAVSTIKESQQETVAEASPTKPEESPDKAKEAPERTRSFIKTLTEWQSPAEWRLMLVIFALVLAVIMICVGILSFK